MGIALLAGHANANTTEVTETTSAITATPNMGAITDSSVTDLAINTGEKISAEDALNARDIAVQKRAAEVRACYLFKSSLRLYGYKLKFKMDRVNDGRLFEILSWIISFQTTTTTITITITIMKIIRIIVYPYITQVS